MVLTLKFANKLVCKWQKSGRAGEDSGLHERDESAKFGFELPHFLSWQAPLAQEHSHKSQQVHLEHRIILAMPVHVVIQPVRFT